MGKKAVPVAYLTNDQNRRNTFKKRLVGLMKKTHDLSILCGAQIAIIVIDESGEISPYTSSESIEDVWQQYSCKSNETNARRLLECKQLLDGETNKAEVARRAKKDTNQEPQDCVLHPQFGWNNNGCIPHPQLGWNNNGCVPHPQLDQNNNPFMQQNQINQGSTSSTMQYQPIASNESNFPMMSQSGPNMHNGEGPTYMTQERNGASSSHNANAMDYHNANHFFQEQQTQYQDPNGPTYMTQERNGASSSHNTNAMDYNNANHFFQEQQIQYQGPNDFIAQPGGVFGMDALSMGAGHMGAPQFAQGGQQGSYSAI